MKSVFLVIVLCLLCFSCAGTATVQSVQTPIPTTEPTLKEKEVRFQVQNGKQIKAFVASKDGKQTALFSPAIDRTDGNLYMVALTMLGEFYGKERGLILLEDAKLKKLASGTAICWEIWNPTQNFCVVTIDVSDNDRRLGGAVFWTE